MQVKQPHSYTLLAKYIALMDHAETEWKIAQSYMDALIIKDHLDAKMDYAQKISSNVLSYMECWQILISIAQIQASFAQTFLIPVLSYLDVKMESVDL